MIAAIIPWLITRGWSAEAAKRIGIGLVIGGIVLFATLFTWAGISFVRYVVQLRDTNVTQQAQLAEKQASLDASNQNAGIIGNEAAIVADQARTTAVQQKEQDDAVTRAPAGATGAATRAANCVRYRQQHPHSVPPAACSEPKG